MSVSTSGTALTDAVSHLTLKQGETREDPRSKDTPLVLSNETLDLLTNKRPNQQPSTSTNKGTKRQRTHDDPMEGTSNIQDIRVRYPIETRAIYLKSKALHKRKLQLAIQINQASSQISKGMAITPCRIRLPCPMKINQVPQLKVHWDNIIKDCTLKLSQLFLDRMYEQYTNIKDSIKTTQSELSDACMDKNQFEEMSTALLTNYKRAASVKPRPYYRSNRQQRNQRKRGPNNKNDNVISSLVKAIKNLKA